MSRLYNSLPAHLNEFDVVLVGGGTAACIIAARLSDADPSMTILVIEGGPNNAEEPSLTYPAFLFSQIFPTSKLTMFYKGIKSDALAGRAPVVPSGGTLGGGSSINFMQYSRGQRSDFDSWNAAGWSADEILPYMKKFETYHGPDPRGLHGSDGPVHVSSGTFRSDRFSDDLIGAFDKVAGWKEVDDINTTDTVNHTMRAMRYVDEKGRRQDAATAFLHPRLQDGKHPNLHVLVESSVERVLFDQDQKANGVVYRPNPAFHADGPSCTVKARRLVVVSAGALGSPLVLERSGIGSAEVVKRAEVEPISELPGVGENYDDHHMMIYAYKTSLGPEETLDGFINEIFTGRSKPEDMVAQNHIHLGWNAIDVQAKVRPSDAEVTSLGPEFRKAWNREFEPYPQKPLMCMASTSCFPGDPTGQPPGQYFGMVSFSVYPFSRGCIHVTGPTIRDEPEFDVGFLNDAGDVDIKNHLWAYKKQREITRRMSVFRGEVASAHPQFPKGSKAACIVDTDGAPLASDVPEVEYSDEDDEAILQWVREHVDTTWHSQGTCKMAPREQRGVVDPDLNVYGVHGLKVADLSIMPGNVGANTNNTAMLIGEKAADIIIRDLGLMH